MGYKKNYLNCHTNKNYQIMMMQSHHGLGVAFRLV